MSERPAWESELDEKIKKFEKKMEEMGRKIEREGKKLEEKAEHFAEKFEEKAKSGKPNGGGFFWGIVFVVAGFIWLGNEFDWFHYDVPWVPLFLIAGGIYMVMRYWVTSKKDEDSL